METKLRLRRILYSHLRSRRIYYAYVKLASFFLGYRKEKGIEVVDRDWDNLIILDACRYDTFQEVNRIDGNLEKVNSVATSTPQWLKRNFDEKYDDIVYISGNPYVSMLARDDYFDPEDHFYEVDHVWDHSWDDNQDTVTPDQINARVRKLMQKYPDKKFIIHYMQPHEPFIGGIEFDISSQGWKERNLRWLDPKVKEAYSSNLEYVLNEIEEVLPGLDGKTVITADHGEILMGKYGFVNHPKDVFLQELQEVPWFEVD